jgi:hypothetical protein
METRIAGFLEKQELREPEEHEKVAICVFRSNPATDYDLTRPPNMIQAGHLL